MLKVNILEKEGMKLCNKKEIKPLSEYFLFIIYIYISVVILHSYYQCLGLFVVWECWDFLFCFYLLFNFTRD